MEEKQYALVTGASSGMGWCYAQALANRGYNLVIVSNEETIYERAQNIAQQHPTLEVQPILMNLATPTAAKELLNLCQQHHWEVEVLVNNAGVYHDRDFLNDSEDFNQLILYLHIFTPTMLGYYFGQQMVTRHKGYVLNMSSITDRIAIQRMGTYGATKAFLTAHTRALHIEWKQQGVYVTTVRPGAVDTGLYSINPAATRIGKALGYIVSPEYLVRRALNGLFRGRAVVSVPRVWNALLLAVIACIPTALLRLIRRLHIF